MQLPDAVKYLRGLYVARFPIPAGPPGEPHEENCRQWSIRFAEQVAYNFPGQGWGMKRAGPGRPISKDTIAQRIDGEHLRIWDLLTGTGTGDPRLNDNPESEELTGQTFVPVASTNHLKLQVPNPEPPTTPTPPAPTDLSAILERLAAIETFQATQAKAVKQLSAGIAALLSRPTPEPLPIALVGRLGYNLRLTWEAPPKA
jgi:hypothetical protein